jgi:serine phosphatase RsbU (regulator of sigma subunit)/anti-sigma regulatory factor (Ser/Thr protein kinase)
MTMSVGSLARFWKRGQKAEAVRESVQIDAPLESPPVVIDPSDPVLTYFQSVRGAVDIDSLLLDSPAVRAMKDAGITLVVPLVAQGELVGLLNLGPKLSDQRYSADDRKLLDTLASQAAPAVRVAQLVRQQEAQARERERLEQELRIAQLIQQQFLPRDIPELPGWRVSAYYRSAREVGGDFYDFIPLPDGKVALVIGDVTDKGVPAALVMAKTHSLLRAEAPRLVSPGAVLERVNTLLTADMPPKMFVTCLYAVLDPESGVIRFANAGHNVPYVAGEKGVTELRARGMPLGLMDGMTYEENEARLSEGSQLLMHSDGLAEAHSPTRDMFGFDRLQEVMNNADDQKVIDDLLSALDSFTGPEWVQEDDITLVTLTRSSGPNMVTGEPEEASMLVEFSVPSELGNERLVMDRVADFAAATELDADRTERLKTAVSEAAMNAIEHGNEGRAELSVDVRLKTTATEVIVSITDHGGDRQIEQTVVPDIDEKLAGLQSPRGWGLFLIENMVDEMKVTTNGSLRTVELVMHLRGDARGQLES